MTRERDIAFLALQFWQHPDRENDHDENFITSMATAAQVLWDRRS